MADENVDGEKIKGKTSEGVTDVAKGKFLSSVMKMLIVFTDEKVGIAI